MTRQRRGSNVSSSSSIPERGDQVSHTGVSGHQSIYLQKFANLFPFQQELGSMYDYLAKIILLGPSGSGKFVGNPFLSTNPRAHIAPGHAYFTG